MYVLRLNKWKAEATQLRPRSWELGSYADERAETRYTCRLTEGDDVYTGQGYIIDDAVERALEQAHAKTAPAVVNRQLEQNKPERNNLPRGGWF